MAQSTGSAGVLRARVPGVWAVALGLGLLAPAGARGVEIADAEIVLEVLAPVFPDDQPEAAPPRFVLLKDRQVFVGGTSRVLTARLEKRDLEPIEKLVDGLRKVKGLGDTVVLGPESVTHRLWIRSRRSPLLTAKGDPARSPAALQRLGRLLSALSDFHHPALRPYQPTSYGLRSREERLVGGCRGWDVDWPPPDGRSTVQPVPAAAFRGWPTGSHPASVCHAGRSYVVTLRPLLPGERP